MPAMQRMSAPRWVMRWAQKLGKYSFTATAPSSRVSNPW